MGFGQAIHNPEGVARGIMNIIRGYIRDTPRTGHAIRIYLLLAFGLRPWTWSYKSQ